MDSDKYAFLERLTSVPGYILAALILFVIANSIDPFFLLNKIRLFWRLHSATNSWLNVTLLLSLFSFFTALGLFLLGKAGLRSAGWSNKKLLQALLFIAFIWIGSQLLLLLAVFFSGQAPAIHADWHNPLKQAKGMLTYFLGVSLYEEFLFRAFLFPQLYLYFKHRIGMTGKTALIRSIILSQLLFGLSHFQAYYLRDAFGGDQLKIFLLCLVLTLAGFFFVFLYLRTQNFFLIVAVHGLLDHPMPLFESSLPAPALVFLVALLLFIFRPNRFSRRLFEDQ